MNSFKIGIVTFHAAENFGSALQAFALQYLLKKEGYTTEIINCVLKSDMEQYKLFRTQYYKERPKAFLGDIAYFRRNFKRRYVYKKFQKRYLTLSKEKFYIGKNDLKSLNEIYDTFICGSDQIWNLNCTNDFIPEFFLCFVNNERKKIAYAPSMPEIVPSKYYERIKTALKTFDAISVREYQTIDYLKNDVGVDNEITQVVDPTLLLESQWYINIFSLKKKKKEKYIFVYILEDRENMNQIINMTIKTSQKIGLKIKYIFIRKIKEFKDSEFLLGIGPREFLDLIYNAEYVITNSFHASVFSIHFEKPFCVFSRSGSQARMIDLLEKLELNNNLFQNNGCDSDFWMDSKADENTKKILEIIRKQSVNFLIDNLVK